MKIILQNVPEEYLNEPNDNEGYVGYIYMTINLWNGRKYIGQHKARKFEHENYLGSGVALKSAVEKYGEWNFKVNLIGWYETEEELNKAEKYWIDYYDAVNSHEFYNIAEGGHGGWGGHGDNNITRKYNYTIIHKGDEQKKIRVEYLEEYLDSGWEKGLPDYQRNMLSVYSSNRVGKLSNRYGKHHSEESKRKISEAKTGQTYGEEFKKKMSEVTSGSNNPMYGKHHSEETKQKIREALVGRTRSDEDKKHMSELMSGSGNPMYGKKRINNGIENKVIEASELDYYLSIGWKRGMVRYK